VQRESYNSKADHKISPCVTMYNSSATGDNGGCICVSQNPDEGRDVLGPGAQLSELCKCWVGDFLSGAPPWGTLRRPARSGDYWEAYKHLEAIRRSGDPVCAHCGSRAEHHRLEGAGGAKAKKARRGLLKCATQA
jgi:hypothetical protein